MEQRIDFTKVSPDPVKPLMNLEGYIRRCGLERPLVELVKMHVSQINGCGFCIDMHWKDARAAGESEQRLYGLAAWEESPYYTDRERAALAWTDAVTNVTQGHVPDAVYDMARSHFSEKELADLTWAVAAINAWNRVAIAGRAEVGTYRPGQHG